MDVEALISMTGKLQRAAQYLVENEAVVRKFYGDRTYLAIKDGVIIDHGENEFELWQKLQKRFPDIRYIPIINLERALNPSLISQRIKIKREK